METIKKYFVKDSLITEKTMFYISLIFPLCSIGLGILIDYITRNNLVSTLSFFFINLILFLQVLKNIAKVRLLLKVLIVTTYIVISSPFVIYSIILIIKKISSNFIIVGNTEIWIAFTGSILGGLMTMIAVFFTIQHQIISDANKFVPFFNIYYSNSNPDEKNIFRTYLTYKDSKLIIGPTILELNIENTSEFLAKNVDIKIINTFNQPSFESPQKNENKQNKLEKGMEYKHDLFPKFQSSKKIIFLEHIDPNEILQFNLEVVLIYEDTFNQIRYQKTTIFRFYRRIALGEKSYLTKNSLIEDVKHDNFLNLTYFVAIVNDTTKVIS